MFKLAVPFLLAFFCVFSSLALPQDRDSHGVFEDASKSRTIDDSSSKDDKCLGRIKEEERNKLEEEIKAVYAKYQKSKDAEKLKTDVSRIFEQHGGSESPKKQAELIGQMSQTLGKLGEISKHYDALSAIEKGEKKQDGEESEQTKAIARDYGILKGIGFKFDPKKEQWDISEMQKETFNLTSAPAGAKEAMARLISPAIAEKFFDPNRKEAFEFGDFVVRPPFETYGGKQTGEFSIVTKEKQNADIQKRLDELLKTKEDFIKSSKEANGFWNSIQGRASETWLGAERGSNGKTAPEIDRDGAFQRMQQLAHSLKGTYGVSDAVVKDLNSVLQDALKQDSAGLQALDEKLGTTIAALRTARNVAVVGGVVLATGGVLAPGAMASLLGAGTTGAIAGGTTGAIGTGMAVSVGLSAIPAAINIGVDMWNGKKFSCAAMEELAQRGPQAVSNALVAAAVVGGAGAVGALGSRILAGASPYVGEAGAGLVKAGAQLGLGGTFVAMGAGNALENGRKAASLYEKAAEAEARGEKDTAKELYAEAFKLAAETGVNLAETAYGASQLARGAQQAFEDFRKVQAAKMVEGADYQPTTKKSVKYEQNEKVASASDLDRMKPNSFAEVDADGVKVRTVTSDGLETVNTANKGDVVMSGPSGEKYVVKGSKFGKLYTRNPDGTVIPEQSPRMVARYDGPESTIKAPWGEEMVVKPGDYIVKEADGKFYRIAKKEYEATYRQPGQVEDAPYFPWLYDR